MRHFVVVFLLFLFGLFLVRTLLMEKLCLPVEYLLLVRLSLLKSLKYDISLWNFWCEREFKISFKTNLPSVS